MKYFSILILSLTVRFSYAQFSQPIQLINLDDIEDVTVADYNNNGELDIVALYETYSDRFKLRLFYNDGSENFFQFKDVYDLETSCYHLRELNLNSNGLNDFVLFQKMPDGSSDLIWLEINDFGDVYHSEVLAQNVSGFGHEAELVVKHYPSKEALVVLDHENIIEYRYDNGDLVQDTLMNMMNYAGNNLSYIPTLNLQSIDLDSNQIDEILFKHQSNILKLSFDGISTTVIDTLTEALSGQFHVSDYDLDGDFDLISIHLSNGINNDCIYISEHDGVDYLPSISLGCNFNMVGQMVDVQDINNDSVLEILIDGYVISQLGGNTFYDTLVCETGFGGSWMDFEHDQYFDLLSFAGQSINRQGYLYFYQQDTTGSFEKNKISEGHLAGKIGFTDLDQDGIDELIRARDGIHIYKIDDGDSYYYHSSKYWDTLTNNNPGFVIGDVNNDGASDLVITSYHAEELYWCKNNNGLYEDSLRLIDSNIVFGTPIVGDFNGDGMNDIVTLDMNSNLYAYRSLGNGNFDKTNLSSNVGNLNFTQTDLDEPPHILLHLADNDSIIKHFIYNSNTLTFDTIIDTIAQFFYPLPRKYIDVNNDSLNDIVFSVAANGGAYSDFYYIPCLSGTNYDTDTIFLFRSAYAQSFITDDFNNDNKLDWVNWNPLSISWYPSDTSITFGNWLINGMNPYGSPSASFHDIHHDNQLDVVYMWNEGSVGHQHNLVYSLGLFDHEYLLRGRVYYDHNQNGIFDSLDIGLSNQNVQTLQSNLLSISDENGNYTIFTQPGTYHTSHNISDWHLTSDSTIFTNTIDGVTPIADSLDFGFFPDSIFWSLNPELIGAFPRCNDTINYWIQIENEGMPIHGIIELILDDSVQLISSDLPIDSSFGQTYYWPLDSLSFFQSYNINLQVQMPFFHPDSNDITSYLNIITIDSSGNLSNTYSDSIFQLVSCSYDPNDKLVSPHGYEYPGYIINDQELEYTIRFQNTGTDTAYNILITDQLSENLDLNSFHLLGSSFPTQTSINGHELNFRFNNINLPDSNTNEIASHGFVKYRISPIDELDHNQVISNEANIYFDFNSPVLTNNVQNVIFICDSLASINFDQINYCENDTFNAVNENLFIDSYQWIVNGNLLSIDSSFSYALFPGSNSIQMIVQNEICTIDTTYSIVANALPTSFISQNDSLLSCSYAHSYQWYINDTVIAGADDQTYTILENGTYMVLTTTNEGCSSFSNEIDVTDLSISEQSISIDIFPNPFSETTTISITNKSTLLIQVVDILGNTLISDQIIDGTYILSRRNLSSGVYFVNILDNSDIVVKSKLIVE